MTVRVTVVRAAAAAQILLPRRLFVKMKQHGHLFYPLLLGVPVQHRHLRAVFNHSLNLLVHVFPNGNRILVVLVVVVVVTDIFFFPRATVRHVAKVARDVLHRYRTERTVEDYRGE